MIFNARVLAIRHLNFLDDAQRPVSGYQLYVAATTNEPGWVQGIEVVKIWIPDGSAHEANVAALLPGDETQIMFNRRGKAVLVDP